MNKKGSPAVRGGFCKRNGGFLNKCSSSETGGKSQMAAMSISMSSLETTRHLENLRFSYRGSSVAVA